MCQILPGLRWPLAWSDRLQHMQGSILACRLEGR